MSMYVVNQIEYLKQHLAIKNQIHQVIKDENEQCHWQEIDSANNHPLVTEKPLSSAKGYFFAEQENLLIFDGHYFRETLPEVEPFVLFGVQSCDLTAIHYQDQFFRDDPYYQTRRERCLLVGIDCIAPCKQGFCPTVDAGPGVKSNTADITLHPLPKQGWLVIVNSAKGEEAVADLELEVAQQELLNKRDQQLAKCIQQFPDDSHIIAGIMKLNTGNISPAFWDSVAIQCLGCSGCTSLCPTCSCYAVRSTAINAKEIKQQRFWDSCLYDGFQREASFNNPSAKAGLRVERFWQHKFSDRFATEFERYGCVGCGRCEQTCPGVIGVHTVMRRIDENA